MRKIAVVAAREYKAAVRTKSFLITLLLMPVLMFGGAALQVFLQSRADIRDKRFAVVDRTPGQKVFPLFQQAAEKRNQTRTTDIETARKVRPNFVLELVPASADTPEAIHQQRLALSDAVRDERYWGFVEIGPDVLLSIAATPADGEARPRADDRRSLRYQTNHTTSEEFPQWAQTQLLLAVAACQSGIPAEKLSRSQGLLLKRAGLSQLDPKSGQIVDPPMIHLLARFIVPAALVGLMFLLIMLSSTPAMHGVVEEKMQRIAEVLLGSVSPFQLMLGKLVGLMGVSLTVAAVYLGGAYWAAIRYGFTEFLPPSLMAWFLLFQFLAVVMYGSLFLAVGAASTDIKETQTLVTPIILVTCIPMMILRNALEDPNGPLVVGASFFPPVTPMLMMARVAIPPGPAWWQPVLAVGLSLAVTLLCVYVAGRIFRVGILLQGKGARLGQMARWVVRG